jgi:hypothetical protein
VSAKLNHDRIKRELRVQREYEEQRHYRRKDERFWGVTTAQKVIAAEKAHAPEVLLRTAQSRHLRRSKAKVSLLTVSF